ncbi:MAG: ABC transporter permease [Oscillospiraceae bacterium]|nr:ABC transporter permease [Oscillospiraceae bacterium]
MKTFLLLTKRNTKLFFKDKGMFFTSLITPIILLVLYATFLFNVYYDSFLQAIPPEIQIMDSNLKGIVGGQLVSSLLAVCCVTVAFCSNMLMVQDKVTGARKDLTVTPVKNSTMALSYYVSSVISTLIICLIAAVAGFIYLANVGWFLSADDVLCILLDVVLLVLFGTALSSVINYFLSSQGQISAVGSIISAGYGFICGAYMPISQFSEGLQKVLSFLPGTYATSLLRNHAMRGAFAELNKLGFPEEVINNMKSTVDCNIEFFGKIVSTNAMYAILAVSVIVLIAAYILINMFVKIKNK